MYIDYIVNKCICMCILCDYVCEWSIRFSPALDHAAEARMWWKRSCGRPTCCGPRDHQHFMGLLWDLMGL